MQAFFSSFSSNLPCFVENQKMLGNGGFKPFSGTFPCALLLQIGEISIFSLYNANLFWGFCLPTQKPLSSFVHCMENIYHFFTFYCNTCPMRNIFSFSYRTLLHFFQFFLFLFLRKSSLTWEALPLYRLVLLLWKTKALESQGPSRLSAPQSLAQFPHRVGGQASAVFLTICVKHRAGSQPQPKRSQRPPHREPLPQGGVHPQVVEPPVQTERCLQLGKASIQGRCSAAQGGCTPEPEHQGLGGPLQPQCRHPPWFFIPFYGNSLPVVCFPGVIPAPLGAGPWPPRGVLPQTPPCRPPARPHRPPGTGGLFPG